jgi:WD40 repeat protein
VLIQGASCIYYSAAPSLHCINITLAPFATAGSDLLILSGHTDRVYSVAYRPNGNQIATWSFDDTVGDAIKGNSPGGVSYSPNGKRLAFSNKKPLDDISSSGLDLPS